jgi:hypothetical protein
VSSGTADTTPLGNGGGRAFGLGSRWARVVVLVSIAILAIAIYLVVRPSPHTTPSPHASRGTPLKYGKIPSWLPSAKPPPDQIVEATEAHPVLAAIEGNTVDVRQASGSAMVTAVGPAIPAWVSNRVQAGHWGDDEAAPSTFIVTFARVKGVVRLRPSAFQILTTQGQVIHPSITGPGGRPMPADLRSGQSITLTMRAGLGEGEGVLRWVPVGTRVLVAWTYELELD